MNGMLTITGMSSTVERLGWVLLHSLWQFALVAIMAGIITRAMQRRSATLRYVAFVTALALCVAAPPTTWLLLPGDVPLPTSSPAEADHELTAQVTERLSTDVISDSDNTSVTTDTGGEPPNSGVSARTTRSSQSPRATAVVTVTTASRFEQIKTALRPWLAWIVGAWSLGVLLGSFRPLLGWHTLWRLKRIGLSPISKEVLSAMHRAAQQLGLNRTVRVFRSTLAQVPIVVGYIKPVILLPTTLVTGMPTSQLEAILAHELAHIRRHDFVINMLQTLIETLFFYHPAVWWLSRRIRVEREHCCDDLVVKVLGNRVEYGRALIAIEELRGQSALLALGAADGSLLSRIRRIAVVSPDRAGVRWPLSLIGLVTLSVLFVMAFSSIVVSRAEVSVHSERKLGTATGLAKADVDDQPDESQTTPKDIETFDPIQESRLKWDKLATDERSGSGAAGQPRPKGKPAQTLFEKWLNGARGNGDIPGGAMEPLARAVTNFIKHNPTHEVSPKLAELLKRIDISHDWTQQDAIALLNDMTTIYPSLTDWVQDEPRFALADTIRTGQPLPVALENAPWGETHACGLRSAWLLEPRAEQHRLGTALKSLVLFHNAGQQAVVFRALSWNQSAGHKARDAQGNEFNVTSTRWTTIPQEFVCRLAPGEYIQVTAAGIGLGTNTDDEDSREIRVGFWIDAKAGDEVTFVPDAVSARGKEYIDPSTNVAAPGVPGWWLGFIKDRLRLDLPLPADATERGRILERLIRDLFGSAPTAGELAEFVSDTSPDAHDLLANRLVRRPGFSTFSGLMKSAATTFHVLPADPDAATRSRTEQGLPAGLEFLRPYPKLHGLSLEMTEQQFLDMARQQELRPRRSPEVKTPHYEIATGDGHIVIVMFGNNGEKCSGIQRIRGELEPQSVPARPGSSAASGWPSFRHDAAQLGVAATNLPDKLVALWEAKLNGPVSGSAAIAGEYVYVPCTSGELVCFEKLSGRRIWTYRSSLDAKSNAPISGFRTSPTITADAVFLGDDAGYFHAIDRATGGRRWIFETNGEIISSAAAMDGKVIFGSYDSHVYCLSVKDGTVVWTFATQGNVHATPTVIGGNVVIAGCDSHLRVIDIATGTEKLDVDLGSNLITSPAVIGDFVFVGTFGGEVISVNWKSGKVAWRHKAASKDAAFLSSPAVNDNLVVIGGRDEHVHAIHRTSGALTWKVDTQSKVDSSPIIVGQRVFVGSDDGNLHEFDLASGNRRSKYRLGGKISASPAVGDGVLVIGSEDDVGKVVCFGSAFSATSKAAANTEVAELFDGSISLEDAAREFNFENKQLERGQDQPLLSVDEAIASLTQDDWKRNSRDVNQEEIAAFESVVVNRRLPKGSYFQVRTSDQRETFRVRHYWLIELYLPAIGHDGFVGVTIRDTKLADELIDPSLIAWGKPDADGLVLGVYLSPRKEQYQFGERIRVRLFVRNNGQRQVPTTWMNSSHPMPEDFTVTSETGENIAVMLGHHDWDRGWVSGAMLGGIAPGETHAFFVPYELRLGGDADEAHKLVGRIIDARPGQTLNLKIRQHNGNDRRPTDNQPESGIVTFKIAARPAPPRPTDVGVQAQPPLLEFRAVAQTADANTEPRAPNDWERRDYPTNSAIARAIAKDQGFVWVDVSEAIAGKAVLPIERIRGKKVRTALLTDTAEHAMPFNGKWSVEECRVFPDPNGNGRFMIEIKFDEAGAATMKALSSSHLNQPLAILVNNEIIAVPIVRSEIGQKIALTGNFSREQAENLVQILRSRR